MTSPDSGDFVPKMPRVVFISATYLSHFYDIVPPETMKDSLFFFGSKRSWVFPRTRAEREDSENQPTDYLSFNRNFTDLILQKESQGQVFWLKPEEDFELVSKWISGIYDPVTGRNYRPLILNARWWQEKYNPLISRFGTSGDRVVYNYTNGLHDYNSVMELLAQSNPTLIPVLYPMR